jgi:hypothetical protein
MDVDLVILQPGVGTGAAKNIGARLQTCDRPVWLAVASRVYFVYAVRRAVLALIQHVDRQTRSAT